MAQFTVSLVNLRPNDQLDYHVFTRDTLEAAQQLFANLRYPYVHPDDQTGEVSPGERAMLLHECVGPRVRLIDQFQTSDSAMEVLNKYYYA